MTECRTFVVPSAGAGNEVTGSDSGYYPFGMLLMMQQLMAGTFVVTGTPSGRTFTVDAENRTFAIPAESRTFIIEC
jgi:hypothetical protein